MADPTPHEMERQVARFARLEPSRAYADERLPGYARTTWTVIGDAADRSAPGAPPLAAEAIRMNLVRCEPGGGAPLHSHAVQEVFMPLDGEWEISWGEAETRTLTLGPLDTIAVPPGVMRGFRNIGERPAMLLAMVGGTDPGRTSFPAAIRALAEAHGVTL
jgi:quercetin dioxygenase-like cupin family protein